MTIPAPEPPFELPSPLRELHGQIVEVLERHLGMTRQTPLTGDLIDQTLRSFDALEALVAPLRLPKYDLETPDGRLMDAIATLTKQMPGVALHTLWRLHEYLATSDDDGVRTRERALGIIQDLGLPQGARKGSSGPLPVFPPLP